MQNFSSVIDGPCEHFLEGSQLKSHMENMEENMKP